MGTHISIFEYETFAAFFRAYVDHRKRADPIFSYRFLCHRLGIRSPSLLYWITTGRRRPTEFILEKLCRYLGMSDSEFAYARCLVAHERARSQPERDFHRMCLEKLRADALPMADPMLMTEAGSVADIVS